MKFEQQGPKEWNVVSEKYEPVNVKLTPSSVTNKFYIVTDFITRVAKFHGEAFSDWFITLLNDCKDDNKRASSILNNVEHLKNYSDTYLESLEFDYSQFVDVSKAKKNSILFQDFEIKEIIRLSCYLKLYSVISNSENMALGIKRHKNIYNKLASNVIDTDIASKIFDVIKTKTFRYNLSDRFMWDYIKTIQCKDIGVHIIEIFNFIMNNIIILCEEDKNPITYFVGVIDESVKWFLRSVYKGTIVYNDEISTEDIHRTHINNLRTYSFNDTLGRLKAISFETIYDKLDQQNSLTIQDQTDQYMIDFNNRLSSIEYISPLCSCLVFPLLSQMTQISYVHFKTISPEHSAILSYYLNTLLQKVFKIDFKNMFQLLDFYPKQQPSMNTTYKIKSIHDFISTQDKTKNFYGFNTKMLPHKILCYYVGRVSRINFVHLLTGKELSGIPLSKVESDMVKFYTMFFAGKLQDKVEQMTALMNDDF
ncbi:MAG: hypothetical protein ACFFG0_01670 [Candidatus Thorarchaeota archaeon]